VRLNVGVTDYDWYAFLSARPEIDECNVWSPGARPFKALEPGELFLFKLKAEHGHMIVGGGYFAHDTLLPLSLAWDAFGVKNGVADLAAMTARIRKYQSAESRQLRDPMIGCRLLQQPFFFEKSAWFRAPDAFPVNAVSGKAYDVADADGALIHRAVMERLEWSAAVDIGANQPGFGDEYRSRRVLATQRLGQGSFRVAITDGFGRRCAVSGEKTLPILDAAHIKPWAAGGENRRGNGVLLRTDIHRLFDLGYVTISDDHHFEVSPRLKEDYENGRHYYDLHGEPIRTPVDPSFLPSADALEWHHNNRWARPGVVE
jgi:putative restriction endonuclease